VLFFIFMCFGPEPAAALFLFAKAFEAKSRVNLADGCRQPYSDVCDTYSDVSANLLIQQMSLGRSKSMYRYAIALHC
jgi:hypothetical protein